ncbi:MAG: hypothetical protein MK198_05325 [Gracilimonas sp.]|uniref:hypothetical protein n=1 Tax=Gracilimonas sp. TaxID=1974203 RepID=UPI0037528D81|nr:hypothetical protein [Gracilimonas sp.]
MFILTVDVAAQHQNDKKNTVKVSISASYPEASIHGIYRTDSSNERYQQSSGFGVSVSYSYRLMNFLGAKAGLGYNVISGDDGHLTENRKVSFSIYDIDLGVNFFVAPNRIQGLYWSQPRV